MNGSINLSMPNARAALMVRSLSEGTIKVDVDEDEHKTNIDEGPCTDLDDSDSLRSLEDQIADSQPAIAHVDVTLHISSDNLTASTSTSATKPKNDRKLEVKQRILERRKKSRLRFSASAADTPIPREHSNSLASCLSSSSYSCNYEHDMSYSSNASTGGLSRKKVTFSRVRVREYEVTCEDLTSSCPVIGLGWRYNPKEKVSRIVDDYIEESDSDVPSTETVTQAMNGLKSLEGEGYPSLDDTKSQHWPDADVPLEGCVAQTMKDLNLSENDIQF